MSTRTALVSAICFAEGTVLDVTMAAIALTRDHLQSGMTLNEVCRHLEEAAVKRRVACLSDRNLPAGSPSTAPQPG